MYHYPQLFASPSTTMRIARAIVSHRATALPLRIRSRAGISKPICTAEAPLPAPSRRSRSSPVTSRHVDGLPGAVSDRHCLPDAGRVSPTSRPDKPARQPGQKTLPHSLAWPLPESHRKHWGLSDAAVRSLEIAFTSVAFRKAVAATKTIFRIRI